MEFEVFPEFLDQEYGPAIDPQNGIKSWEYVDGKIIPILLMRETGKFLIDFLKAASSTAIVKSAVESIKILWAIDEAGDIFFAVEDVIDTKNDMLQRPRTRGITLNDQVKPLGHPLLVNLGKGRISGEIYLDQQNGRPTLVITNMSGRYGRHPSRSKEHLDNVVRVFGSFNVPLIPDFQSTVSLTGSK